MVAVAVLLLARPFSPNSWDVVTYVELVAYLAGAAYGLSLVCLGRGGRVSKLLWFLWLVMPAHALVSANQAYAHFGQPLSAGLITERARILLPIVLLGVLPLMEGRSRNSRTHRQRAFMVGDALLIAAWATILVDVCLALTGRGASSFEHSEGLFYVDSTQLKVLEYLPLAAVCLCLSRLLQRATGFLAIQLVALVAYYAFVEVSSTQQALFAAAGAVLIGRACYKRRIGGKAMILAFAAMVLIILGAGDWFALFGSIQSSGAGVDVAANIRYSELTYLFDTLPDDWFLGVGKVSDRVMGGLAEQSGEWFFAGDLGLLGAVYLYGVFAFIPILIQGYITYRLTRIALGKAPCDAVTVGLWAYSVIIMLRVTLLGDAALRPSVLIIQVLAYLIVVRPTDKQVGTVRHVET